MKTKAVQFTGYANTVADQMNRFLNDFEKSGNNIKILFQTQSSSANGQVSVFLTYYEDDLPRHIPTREEIAEKSKLEPPFRSEKPEEFASRMQKKREADGSVMYDIRRSVFNMTREAWEAIRPFEDDDFIFSFTINEFISLVNKDGGFISGLLNEKEKEFADMYYAWLREQNGGA